MSELTFAAAIVVWGLLPGLMLLQAVDVDWTPLEKITGAPGVSLALVALAAYAAEIAGLPVRPMPVVGVVMALCALAWLARRVPGRRVHERDADWPAPMPFFLRWAPWLVLLLPFAIAAQLTAVSEQVLLPPPMHDGLDHARWFRLIYELSSLSPATINAPPFGADGAPIPYPWGMHAWLALVAHTTTMEPMVVLMRSLVLMSAVAPLSIYVFTAHLTGRGWVAVGAAAISIYFWWVPYQMWGWGGFALLAGLVAALPVTRLALTSIDARSAAAAVAAGACLVGVLLIHPSQLFAALIIGGVVSVTLAAGRARPWQSAVPFALVFGAAALVLSLGGVVWPPLGEFLTRAAREGAALSSDPRYGRPIGTLFDSMMPLPYHQQMAFGLLCAAGAVVAVVNRRVRPLLALHLVFGLLVLAARQQSWMTTLWYHMPERIWYAEAAAMPALAAAGAGGVIVGITRLAARWRDLSRWQWVLWVIACVLVFDKVHDKFTPWASIRLFRLAHRNPQLAITDKRLLVDFAWMRENIPRGEVVFNAPADWGLSLPFTGHRTVYWAGGPAVEPSVPWNSMLRLLRRAEPHTSLGAAEIRRHGIHYIYAGRLDTALERGNREPLDGATLRAAAGLELLYESPTALIFRIRDSALAPR
ncbi:MAG: hypothetical protein M3Q55_03295 [Acidobacteriota bacterium]|nr:hypothetical protein [Acidobacteriota bacterium]